MLKLLKTLFTSGKFYAVIGGLIALGALFLVLLNVWIMPAYTNFHEGVTVPDVTKVSLTEAQQRLKDYGLRYEVAERRAHASYPADYVIDQTPSPLSIVKPNRKVYLTVNTAVRPTVVMPNLVNLSLRNAKLQLQNYGLELGSTSYESSRFKNTILRQSVKAGTRVPKGTVVDLAVSDGLGVKKVPIPDIVGLRLTKAQNALRKVGLRVGETRFQPSKEYEPNVVLGYQPSDQDSLTEGESLRLIISERYEVKEETERGAVIIDSTGNAPADTAAPEPTPFDTTQTPGSNNRN